MIKNILIDEDEMSLDTQIAVYDMRIRVLTTRRDALAAVRALRDAVPAQRSSALLTVAK